MNTARGRLSRRKLVTGVTLSAAAAFPQVYPLTAGRVVDRIKENVGVSWRQTTVDNIIAGTRDTPVKGIATTMMATLDVIQRAAAAGLTMVITHESTFFSHQDAVEGLEEDATYRYKRDFLTRNGMAVFHRDCWRLQQMRRRSHDKRESEVFPGSARARGADGVGARRRVAIAMGSPDGRRIVVAGVNYEGQQNTLFVRLQVAGATGKGLAMSHTIAAGLKNSASLEDPDVPKPVSRAINYARELDDILEPWSVAVVEIRAA